MSKTLARRLVSEATGTALLLAAIVGSGIMGDRLAGGNTAVALLANTLATRAALAAHLGTVREQASRALSALKRRRLIEVDGRKVRVISPDLLRNLGS